MSDAPVTKITQAEFDALSTSAPREPAVGEAWLEAWRKPSESGFNLVYRTGRWCCYGDEFITHRIDIVERPPGIRSPVLMDADSCKDEARIRGGER